MKTAKIFLAAAALLSLTSAVQEASGSNFVILKRGTPVVIELAEEFNAASMKEGGNVPMVVAEKVTNEGLTLIGAGAPVAASFVPGKTKGEGAGYLRISSALTTDEQDVVLRVSPEVPEAAGDDDRSDPSLIPVREENSRMPQGTSFTVYLADTYFIED